MSQETERRFAAIGGYFQGLIDFDEREANIDIIFLRSMQCQRKRFGKRSGRQNAP